MAVTNRKLDAQLAKHLFGWTHRSIAMGHLTPPPFTADWNGAGRVIEKMREHPRKFNVDVLRTDVTGRWTIRFHDGRVSSGWSEATHESFPIAVALAALRTLGVEVEE